MGKARSAESDCPVCDLWWVLWLVVLVVVGYFTRNYWWPGPESAAPIATATPLSGNSAEGTPTESGTDEANSWLRFKGAGYELMYPKDWYASPAPPPNDSSDLATYDLILTNAPSTVGPAYATDDQTTRLVITLLPLPTEAWEVWVTREWAWLDTELTQMAIGSEPGLTAKIAADSSSLFQEYVWFSHSQYLYVLEATGDASDTADLSLLHDVIASITPE